jgi:serine/threonine-protein kinase
LLSHFLGGRIGEKETWFQRAFLWEKRQLYKQLQLYYHCCGDIKKAAAYSAKAEEYFLDIF